MVGWGLFCFGGGDFKMGEKTEVFFQRHPVSRRSTHTPLCFRDRTIAAPCQPLHDSQIVSQPPGANANFCGCSVVLSL